MKHDATALVFLLCRWRSISINIHGKRHKHQGKTHAIVIETKNKKENHAQLFPFTTTLQVYCFFPNSV